MSPPPYPPHWDAPTGGPPGLPPGAPPPGGMGALPPMAPYGTGGPGHPAGPGPLDGWLVPLMAPFLGMMIGLFAALLLSPEPISLSRSFLGSLKIVWDLLAWLGVGEGLVRALMRGDHDQAAALTGLVYLVAMLAIFAAILLVVPVINLTLVVGGCATLLGFAYSTVRLFAGDARHRHGGYTLLRVLGGACLLWLLLGAWLLTRYEPGAVAAFLAFTSPLPVGAGLLAAALWLIVRALAFRRR